MRRAHDWIKVTSHKTLHAMKEFEPKHKWLLIYMSNLIYANTMSQYIEEDIEVEKFVRIHNDMECAGITWLEVATTCKPEELQRFIEYSYLDQNVRQPHNAISYFLP